MPVSTEHRDRIFIITLDRPEAMNSIDPEMHVQLSAAWDEFEQDDGLQVAILTGAGEKAFCAGRDLVKSAADPANDWSQRQGRAQRRIRLTPDGIEKPVIAAINGYCLAAGLALALGCDLRIASENASFGTMAARRGIVAGGGQTQRLARYIPFGIAMEMVMFGERISAQRAYEVGLVNRLVPEGAALESAIEWAEKLGENGPLAVRAMKQLLYEGGLGMPLDEGLRLEARRYSEIMETEDAKEGPRAFAEKRKAEFKGR
jgi:enoyl-CoA hydratase/carnithine racemase